MELLNTTSFDYGRWNSDLTQILGSYKTSCFPIHPKNATFFLRRWLAGKPEWRSKFIEAAYNRDQFKKAIVHAIDRHAIPARAKEAVLDSLRGYDAIEDNDGYVYATVNGEPIAIEIRGYCIRVKSEEIEIPLHIVNGTLPIPSTLTVEAIAAYNKARNGGER